MVLIERGGNNGTLADRLFTLSVNIIQSTIVHSRVSRIKKEYLEESWPRASLDFNQKLMEVGLSYDHLWWGPMTLFPRKAEFLLTEIEKDPPKKLLEIGSGTSTILFAALAAKYQFKMLSLDNYKNTINYVESELINIPCDEHVKLQQCGFVKKHYHNGMPYRWYDAILDKDGPFDFVFIDGPMGKLVGRNGAIPEIKPYLANKHKIYLDDYNRKHEKACVSEWKSHFPELSIETFKECPGIARLHISR